MSEKRLAVAAAALSLAMVLASGCNSQKFGLGSESQEFGEKVTYNTQVDMLWVIDTSSSMNIYQDLLAPQMGVMVDALNQTGLDYHMAVTTMDMSGSGGRGQFVAANGTPLILNAQTPDLVNVLKQRIQLGGNGSSVERGLEAMRAALSSPLASSTGYNAGFLRPNAMLVVVFLSNEDDQSAPADYGSFLDGIRPPLLATGERSWMTQFMGVVSSDPSCKTSAWGYSAEGTKYIALSNQSGGVAESICDADLRRALTNVKARILEVVTEFHLDRTPNLATLAVYVNGVLIPQNPTNGWTYYSVTNTIRFHGVTVPSTDARIRIDYDPSGIK